MKKFILFLLIAVVGATAKSQTIINGRYYNNINAWYKWKGGRFDSTLLIPLSIPVYGVDTGALYYAPATDELKIFTGGTWRVVGGGGGGTVSSVFGRTGVVVADINDYLSFYPTISRFGDSMAAIQFRLDTTRNGIRGDLNGKVSLSGSYANPSWITSLAWAKIPDPPTIHNPGGINGNVQYFDGTTFAGTNNFFWNNTTNRLGILNSGPSYTLDVSGDARITGTILSSNQSGSNRAIHIGSNAVIPITYSNTLGNVIIGDQTNTRSGMLSENLLLGRLAGNDHVGEASVFIGNRAGIGTTGRGNVFIGAYANFGPLNHTALSGTVNGKFMVGSSPTTGNVYTLMYGDFQTGQLFVNPSNTDVPTIRSSVQFGVGGTTGGFLPPVVTGTQMAAIPSPTFGVTVANSDSLAWCFFDGTVWKKFGSATGGGGGGTVTSFAFTNTTGITGTVTSATSTPTLSLAIDTSAITGFSGKVRSLFSAGSGLSYANGVYSLTSTTVGNNFLNLTNPSAITFPRINADNTVSALDAATFRSAIGAGTGTVTSVSGTTNRISSTGGATPVIDIDAAYIGQTSITTVGTIATGTWNATTIADGKIASALTGKTYNGLTLTANATGFQIAGGTTSKTAVFTNNLTFSGTDGSTLNIGAGGTLGSAAFTASSAYEVPLTFSTGLTRTTNTITVNTTQNISTLSNLTTNGLIKTGGGTGALSIATPGTDYLQPFGSQTANFFYAAPNGAAGAPTFRAIVAADIPTLNQSTTGSAATLTTGRTIGITGDIVYTSPSFNGSANITASSTIQPGVVSYSKIQNVAANTFLANATGSAATVQEISTNRIPLFGTAITGTPSSTTYLRGDGQWATPAGGGGGSYTFINSLTETTGTVQLVNDNATPGNNFVYGTNSSGTKGWQASNLTTFTSLADKDYLRYNNSTGAWNNVTPATVKTDLSLNNVENTALSTWAGTNNINTIGTATANGQFTLPDVPSPTSPAAGKISIYNYKLGGAGRLGVVDENGWDNAVQYHLARNGFVAWLPAGNSTTITTIHSAALTATGTATAANYATTNRYTKTRKVEYLVTTAATTAVAGWREAANQYIRDDGFQMVCRFGPATGVATTTNRLFVGMTNSTAAPTDVQPSSLTNMFGVGWDAADANIQFFTNDGTGTATKTDLGIAVPTVDRTSAYEIIISAPVGGTSITYTFTDLVSGTKVSGTITTDFPTGATTLSPRGWMSVGGTSSVIGIALMSLSMETDF